MVSLDLQVLTVQVVTMVLMVHLVFLESLVQLGLTDLQVLTDLLELQE